MLSPSVVLARTGEEIVFREQLSHDNQYTVLTDNEDDLLLPNRNEAVRFQVSNAQGEGTADFVFRRSTCHVEKLSGPDTLVIQ